MLADILRCSYMMMSWCNTRCALLWTGYTLSYRQRDEADVSVIVVNLTSTSLNHTITGLHPTTVYTVELYASTRVGSGRPRSDDVQTAVTPGIIVHWSLVQARLIVRKRKYDGISATIRDALHWLLVWQRVEFKLSVLVFNCLHNLAPSYLSTMCQSVADNAGSRHLRAAARGDLAVPVTGTVRYGPHSRTVHVELSSSIATQLPPSILVPSWSENCTVHQSIPLAGSWLFITVRAGKHNSSTHHHHIHHWISLAYLSRWFSTDVVSLSVIMWRKLWFNKY